MTTVHAVLHGDRKLQHLVGALQALADWQQNGLHPDSMPALVVPGMCPYARRYIVLMSDGIFEFMDSQQILEEVHTAAQAGQPPSEVAKKLVKMARK